MVAAEAAMANVSSVYITVEGIGGNLAVTGIGTATMYVVNEEGVLVGLAVHQCLQSNGNHNLLSLSQLLAGGLVEVELTIDDPVLIVLATARRASLRVPMRVIDGMFVLPFATISPEDPRRGALAIYDVTSPMEYVPVSRYFQANHKAAGTVMWRRVNHLALAPGTVECRFPDHPVAALVSYRERLRDAASSVFVDSTTRPTARRLYSWTDPASMADLSTRMMSASHDRLKHTIEVSCGLSKRKGDVRANRFPQGTLTRGQVPAVKKRLVHHLHQAATAEVVFTDAFESGGGDYKHGQAFVCYRSRFGHVVAIKSRRQAGRALRLFCANVFTPLTLTRDNINEQRYGEMLEACLEMSIQSGFSTPKTQEEDYAEGFIGRICQMATFAMIFSGAPMFLWRYAVISAVFIYNITAGWYSVEQVWATPYELLYGEPFPDSSIVVPWGCGALILLTKDERKKFGSRCALVVFTHYATQHPTYTYGFWSPRTGREIFRRDAIFLVDVFPLRWGNEPGCKDGAMVTPCACERAAGSIRGTDDDFPEWAGPTLPSFVNLTIGKGSEDSAETPADFPPSRHISGDSALPAHASFGVSAVQVPLPNQLAADLSANRIGETFQKDFGRHGTHQATVMSYDADAELCVIRVREIMVPITLRLRPR